MQSAQLPDNEDRRLEALHRYGLLDSEPEAAFDDITEAATTIFGTPISLVTLVDEDRQWFKSRCGLDIAETDRDSAFCAHAILDSGVFVVGDARTDERFADNPLVEGEPYIRFYAGAPITVSKTLRLGTLCIIDTVPRSIDPERLRVLEVLRDAVAANLELRQRRALDDSDTLLALCAWCSRVRRAEDRQWISMNRYLESKQKVTHTICPECRDVVMEDS